MLSFEVPRTLPVDHLSHSSLNLYWQCPLRWKKKYIDKLSEPSNPYMLIGKAVGTGAAAGYVAMIAGEENWNAQIAQITADTVEEVCLNDEIDMQDSTVGELKDIAVSMVGHYHDKVMVHMKPTAVERGFKLSFPETDWSVIGYVDVVGEGVGLFATLHDIKTVGRASNAIDADLQCTMYSAAAYADSGTLPGYAWHQIRRPTKKEGPEIMLLTTVRSEQQIINYLARVAQAAREIEWRQQTGDWAGAPPGSTWCSVRRCHLWADCPYGGKQ